jgi:hypothetical protein
MPDTQPQQSAPATSPTSPPAAPVAPPPTTPPAKPNIPPADVKAPDLKRSSHLKLVLGISGVFLLFVVGIIFYQVKSNQTLIQESYKITPSATPSLPPSPTPTPGMVKSGDAELDQQGESIDANMQKLNNDLNNVDKGLQDKAPDLN